MLQVTQDSRVEAQRDIAVSTSSVDVDVLRYKFKRLPNTKDHDTYFECTEDI